MLHLPGTYCSTILVKKIVTGRQKNLIGTKRVQLFTEQKNNTSDGKISKNDKRRTIRILA